MHLPDRRGGWLADPDDPDSRISKGTADEVATALAGVPGGMRPKLEACVAGARRAACSNAHIIDGRRPHSLLLELFTDEGIGTKLWP